MVTLVRYFYTAFIKADTREISVSPPDAVVCVAITQAFALIVMY